MPLVYEDIGASENLHMRMSTSLIRHHTILIRPIIGYLHKGKILNNSAIKEQWIKAVKTSRELTESRLNQTTSNGGDYTPVGYILSVAANEELSISDRNDILSQDRERRRTYDAKSRLQ